jgi:MYXO-CTERM domain-containing protein
MDHRSCQLDGAALLALAAILVLFALRRVRAG